MVDERDKEANDQPNDPEADDSDTTGHSILPNMVFSQQAAVQRQRDIQRNLKQHQLEVEARRPHRKESKG